MSYTPKNPNGSATSANSSPVVIASDQSTIPVSVSGVSTAANQSTIIGHVDGIETLIGTTNTTLSTIDGRVDGLETLVTSTNTKLDTLITSSQLLDDAIYTDGTGTVTKGVAMLGQDGTNPQAIKTDANGELQVDVLTMPTVTVNSHAVTNAGTFAVQVDGSALTSLQLLDDTVFADDAAFTLGTSKGSVMEGVAVNMDGTDPTAVSAEGDAAALRTDPNRILLANLTHPRFFHVSADYASAQTNVSVKAAPGASLSLYITDISLSNGATAGNITLLDGSGGTVLYEIYPAINGGATLSLRNPIKLTANTALCLTSTSCTTHSVFVSGYIAA